LVRDNRVAVLDGSHCHTWTSWLISTRLLGREPHT